MHNRTGTRDRYFLTVPSLFALVMIGLALVGAVRSYSAIPYWDMWDGYLGFYLDIKSGRYSAWFAQHNEHRILLARILFYIDLAWLHGSSWFLVAANYVLVGISAFTFWTILEESHHEEPTSVSRKALGILIVAMLFSWMQEENLTQAFQSQFILAQLLPLLAFYWLHRSASGARQAAHYGLAVLFGIASIGTMANGVMALPLMSAYAIYSRQDWKRIGWLILASVATLVLYFHDYHAVEGHGSLAKAFFASPSSLILYVLLYFGSPAKYLLAQRFAGDHVAPLAGLLFLAGCGIALKRALTAGRRSSLSLVLLFFIIYVLGTAIATAGGRLAFGAEQAVSSRYTTPVLMAWAALSIAFSASLIRCISFSKTTALLVLIVFGVFTLRLQYRAVESKGAALFEREVSALALELQVEDWRQIEKIAGPVSALAFSYVPDADRLQASVFGTDPLRGMRSQLGTVFPIESSTPCPIPRPRLRPIEGVTGFVRVGQSSPTRAMPWPPLKIRILNSEGVVIGYAFGSADALRPAAPGTITRAGVDLEGYVLSGQARDIGALRSDDLACTF